MDGLWTCLRREGSLGSEGSKSSEGVVAAPPQVV